MVHTRAKTPSGKIYLRLNLSAMTMPKSDVTKFCVTVFTEVERLGKAGKILFAEGFTLCNLLLDGIRVPVRELFHRHGLLVKFVVQDCTHEVIFIWLVTLRHGADSHILYAGEIQVVQFDKNHVGIEVFVHVEFSVPIGTVSFKADVSL